MPDSTLITQALVPADSLGCDSIVTHFVSSGFKGTLAPVLRMSQDVIEGWNLIVIALVLLLIVLNKQLYPRQFRQTLTIPQGTAQTNQLLREWSPTSSFLGISFLFAYIVIMALFVQKACVIMSRDVARFNSFGTYCTIAACVTGWVLLRYAILYFMNWLFATRDAVERQTAVQLSLSTLCLIAMLPLLLLLLYNPYSAFVWVGIGIIGLFVLIRAIKDFIETRVVTKIPSFYIFLYFCALEIVPVLTLVEASTRYFSKGSVF